MQYDFSPLKKKIKDVEEWLKKEQSQIRTGRATPTLLDGVLVEAYGSKVPLIQVGSISNEDPRTLRISVWDQSQIKEVERGIIAANLGVSAIVDDKGVRVAFPELTGERRQAITKIAKEKLEDARITLRRHRGDTWDDIQAMEKEGGMSEDERVRFKEEMEKIIKEANNTLDDLHERKEKEIMS